MGRPRVSRPTFSLTQRGGIFYVRFWCNNRPHRRSTGCKLRPAAEEFLAKFKADFVMPEPAPLREQRYVTANAARWLPRSPPIDPAKLADAAALRANRLDAYTGSGIYFLFRSSEVVYVGQSTNVLARVGSHAVTKDFDEWAYVTCPTRELLRTERAYIQKFHPVDNMDGSIRVERERRQSGELFEP